jgi:phosphotriesterase-related protein
LALISADALGSYSLVLAHEHLLIDIRCWLDESHVPTRHLRDAAVGAATLSAVRTNPFACLDNLVLDDRDMIAGELSALRDLDALVVDVTPHNVGRDLDGIAWIAEAAGVDVVTGCGPYIWESRPHHDPGRPAEAYRDDILAALDGPRPPAVIGEIGTGDPIQPGEVAALTGAALAQRERGVPLYVHLHPWGSRGNEALDIVERAGGDLTSTVLCHLDAQIPNGLDLHRSLLARGCLIAFDIWGDELAYGAVRMPTDDERIAATLELVADGFGARLVHSHDVCTKTQLRRFGGAGYDHLPRIIAPRLSAAGMDSAELHRQLAGNALALLKSIGHGKESQS